MTGDLQIDKITNNQVASGYIKVKKEAAPEAVDLLRFRGRHCIPILTLPDSYMMTIFF
jgi:hypothetical protein